MNTTNLDATAPCLCGFGATYAACCGPLHDGAPAPTAAQLMRSRYSAFATGDADYLVRSWHPSTRPPALELDPDITWLRLAVESTEGGGPFDTEGFVTFTAIARQATGRMAQRERSRFLREGGHWFYVDGTDLEA